MNYEKAPGNLGTKCPIYISLQVKKKKKRKKQTNYMPYMVPIISLQLKKKEESRMYRGHKQFTKTSYRPTRFTRLTTAGKIENE